MPDMEAIWSEARFVILSSIFVNLLISREDGMICD